MENTATAMTAFSWKNLSKSLFSFVQIHSIFMYSRKSPKECSISNNNYKYTKKINFMYKVYNNMVPSYISDLIPPTVGELNRYPLRNAENSRIPASRTTLMQRSCIPSSIELWNNLDINLRLTDSLTAFKASYIQLQPQINVPKFFICGKRHSSILHARL